MFNIFEPEQLRDAMGTDRCSFGMPFIQASLNPDGKLKARIGAGEQKTKMNDERWVRLFNAAGLPAVFKPEMLLWLRCHVPLCVAFESVSVAAVRRSGGASWTEALTIARGLQESLSLVQRSGYRLLPGKQGTAARCASSRTCRNALVHVAHPFLPGTPGHRRGREPCADCGDGEACRRNHASACRPED